MLTPTVTNTPLSRAICRLFVDLNCISPTVWIRPVCITVDPVVMDVTDGAADHVGAAPVLPIRTCPVVPAAVAPIALAALPYTRPY